MDVTIGSVTAVTGSTVTKFCNPILKRDLKSVQNIYRLCYTIWAMSTKLVKEDIAKMFLCSSILEEHVYKAYNSLADRVMGEQISRLLRVIAYDSIKHSIMLKLLSESIAKVDVKEVECKNLLGESWKIIDDLAKEEIYSVPDKMDLPTLIKNMVSLESYVGEEYMTSAHLVLTKLAAEEIGLELDTIKNVIEWIIQDEERHVKIIEIISKMI